MGIRQALVAAGWELLSQSGLAPLPPPPLETNLTAHYSAKVDSLVRERGTALQAVAPQEHTAGPERIVPRLNHFGKPGAWDHPRARAYSRKPCSRHFRDSNLHDEACRRQCKISGAEMPRQTACGSKGRRDRPLISLPFSKVKCIPPNLYQVSALQCAIARWR